ncbi:MULTISPECIES: sugar kinase [unclassified Streptomyces]|uniref:sugar kinase n=1 Tax=unclassified Streptomyces TaxID=2593676 RepID=UPI0022513D62|nr:MULTISPECIES: sugar kinase [unclassified Streptomyces]MCX4987606.1 sugar kinase [Streptomyces sp. NBC_00568]MCX5007262.1 sugar kinase [Streptomyces sp. NBC_00638]
MTASLPRQASPPDEPQRPPEDPRHKVRRRALTLLIIVLLIGVPAGYLVISANQSRDSGKDKEEKYSATGLTSGWPSRVQRRLYQVPIPGRSTDVAYYETNNWKTSRLYVQFGTNEAGLDKFLADVGTSRDALEKGDVTINGRDQKVVGWEFTGPGPWWGLVHKQKDPAPTQDIVVNRSEPGHPMVYVVSRTIP